MRWCEH